jgi:hypothetical protein
MSVSRRDLGSAIAALREGVRLLPLALRKPALLRRWLVEARGAQIALASLLVVALFLLPPLLGWALPRLYPPVEIREKVLGIFARATSRPDPRLEARARQLTLLVWAGGIGGVALLLIGALPRSAAAARSRARSQEDAVLRQRLSEVGSRADAPASERATALPDDALRALRAAETLLVPATDPGVVAGRYRIVKELGRGAMGVVHRALDLVLEREVALKELPPHLVARVELVRRFRQEARLLARLVHPSIVQVHDLIEEDGRLWIALELVAGGTLADALQRRGGALPWRESLRFAAQIAEGLAFAHSRGVIHRDIKPSNVLLSEEDPPAAKLADFGLARWIESSEHTQHGALLGSARYMSPEQAAGSAADERSDLYSLGIALFELLCGRAPYEGQVAAVLAQHLSGTPPRLGELCAGLPPELEALVMSLIARSPGDRPGTAEAVVRALRDIASAARG